MHDRIIYFYFNNQQLRLLDIIGRYICMRNASLNQLLVNCCIRTYTCMKMTIIISVTVLLTRVCNILFCTTVHNQTRICELFLQSNAREFPVTRIIRPILFPAFAQARYVTKPSRIASVSKQESISNNLIPFEFFLRLQRSRSRTIH